MSNQSRKNKRSICGWSIYSFLLRGDPDLETRKVVHAAVENGDLIEPGIRFRPYSRGTIIQGAISAHYKVNTDKIFTCKEL